MQFKFSTSAGTYDLTDYVDRMDIEVERVTASTSAGLFVPSSQIGASWNAGLYLNTSGIIAAANYPALRSIISQILDHRSGYLQIESDRRIKAVLDSVRFSEWEGGTPLMRLSMRWLTAGYAESVEVTYGTPISGVGWTLNNDGDLPAPMYIWLEFQNAQSAQSVLILGGVPPDGNGQLNIEWKGDVAADDALIIDAGVYGDPSVNLNSSGASDRLVGGYPPYAKVGNSTINYSLMPYNVLLNQILIIRKRWRLF